MVGLTSKELLGALAVTLELRLWETPSDLPFRTKRINQKQKGIGMPYTEPPIKTGCKSSDSKTMQGHHKLIWSNWNDRWQCDNKGCSFKTKEKPRKEVKQNVTEIKGRPTAKKDRESSNQKSRQEPVKELKVGFFSGMFGNSADKKAAEEFRKRNKGR